MNFSPPVMSLHQCFCDIVTVDYRLKYNFSTKKRKNKNHMHKLHGSFFLELSWYLKFVQSIFEFCSMFLFYFSFFSFYSIYCWIYRAKKARKFWILCFIILLLILASPFFDWEMVVQIIWFDFYLIRLYYKFDLGLLLDKTFW